jgi:hypothetical protein
MHADLMEHTGTLGQYGPSGLMIVESWPTERADDSQATPGTDVQQQPIGYVYGPSGLTVAEFFERLDAEKKSQETANAGSNSKL